MTPKRKLVKQYHWGCPDCGCTAFERVVTVGATQKGEFNITGSAGDWGEVHIENIDVEQDDVQEAEEFECQNCGCMFKEPGRIFPKPEPGELYPGQEAPSMAGMQHVVVRVFVDSSPIVDRDGAFIPDEEKEKNFSKRVEFIAFSQEKVDAVIAAVNAMLTGLEG